MYQPLHQLSRTSFADTPGYGFSRQPLHLCTTDWAPVRKSKDPLFTRAL